MKLTRIHFTAPVEFAGAAHTRILCDKDPYRGFDLDYDEARGIAVIRKDGSPWRVIVPLGNVRAMEADETDIDAIEAGLTPPIPPVVRRPTAVDSPAVRGEIKVHRSAPAKQ